MTSGQNIGALSGNPDFLLRKAVGERIVLPIVCVVGLLLSVCANWLFPGLGLAVCVMTVATVLLLSVSRSIELVIFAFLFQNVMIAVIGGAIGTFDGATVAKATNFLLCMTVWGMCLTLYLRYPAEDDNATIMKATFVVLGVMGVYFAYGVAKNGSGAIIYLRNLIIPLVCLQIGITASRYGGGVAHFPTWIVVAFLAYCYVEVIFGVDFLQLMNIDNYSAAGGTVDPTAAADEQFTARIFNTSLFGDLGNMLRLRGPNIHPISVAYALSTFALLCILRGRYMLMALFFPLMVFAGSKGAVAYFLFCAFFIWAAQRFNPKLVIWSAVGLAAVYGAALFIVGRNDADFHVLGLIGSLKGFMSNPLGYGIGAGGNLNSSLTLEQWQTFQHQGFTDTALESGVGVLLYQMGIAGAGVLAFYGWVASRFWKRFVATRDPMAAFGTLAMLFILTNSIFQEEALFAPLCLAFALLVAASGTYFPQHQDDAAG